MARLRRPSRSPAPGGLYKFFRREMDFDVEKEWARLRDIGKVSSDDLRDRFKLAEHINRAGENAVRARAIAGKLAVDMVKFRVEYGREMGKMKRIALRQVDELNKVNGIRGKQITNDMIIEWIVSNPKMSDQYAKLEQQMEEYKALRSVLDEFAKQWSERKNTLQSQARLVSAERELKLNTGGGE